MQDFEQQRMEAYERVREMNKAYRQKAGIEQNKPLSQNKKNENGEQRQNKSLLRSPADLLKMLKLDGLKSDPDRLLILGIFLLLSSEESDELLLYALLYIML